MTKSRGIRVKRVMWSDAQLDVLRARYPHEKTESIAVDLGMTARGVYQKAAQLGLKKTQTYMESPDACRLRRGDNVGAAYRFKPGIQVWNKGMKGLHIGGEATQFKKGHLGGRAADVVQPIGAVRISKDGYLQRKINNDLPFQKRWRGVHILVWEEINGPLPAGHAICFKDGNKQNVAIENLELVSRADLMRRNTYHQYGKEIAQVIQLKGQITRQINRRERNAK